MHVLLTSSLLVALAEIGDKTQFLALVLIARFRKPLPIVAGMLIATLLNHGLAALAGRWIGQHANLAYLHWALAASFIVLGIWVLVPEKLEAKEDASHTGAFLTSLTAFFLAEIGDKTQFATIALAAQYQQTVLVVTGSTLGILLADAPTVFGGQWLLARIPLKFIRRISALLFIGLGIWMMVGLRNGS